jgi:hypothetical protein
VTSIDSTVNQNGMPAGRWLAMTLTLAALLVGINLAVAWRMDVFGIFRDPTGRKLVSSEHERKAKYLLNQAYVPDNFDALIVGASASVNWRTGDLTGFRFYNESLEGGDASEERRLVEQALPKGHFKVAIVGLYPRITSLHLLQDGFDQVKKAEALGSISSFGIEYDAIRDRIHPRPATFFPDGSHVLPTHGSPGADQVFAPIDIQQDSIAVEDYRALVQELMDRGVRVIYVAYPLYGRFYEASKDAMETYMSLAKASMPPAPLIDFNSPQYASFRNDPQNYIDEIHLSAQGTAKFSLLLDAKIHEILGN